jgi:hypothetical protein
MGDGFGKIEGVYFPAQPSGRIVNLSRKLHHDLIGFGGVGRAQL